LTEFEQAFADYCGVHACIGVANGTDALELALRGLGVVPGDRVALVANAGFYGSAAIRAIGAVPTYVDVDPLSLQLSLTSLESALPQRPAAIIVTHLYGLLADIESIVTEARRHGIPVVEDCAQAHGAARSGRRAGSFGTIGCFSFYPTKNLGALGDGGALVTDDEGLANRVRRLRQYGWEAKYHVQNEGGRNSRLDELQAAVLLDRLPHLDTWNAARRSVAATYADAFAGLPMTWLPWSGDDYVAHLFVVQLAEREDFRRHLAERGIATEVHYPTADHQQYAYAARSPMPALPQTERACRQVVSLPCYPGLTDSDLRRVTSAVRDYFEGRL
jgi:dTDP-4-amino-4,6-dideoxygalactose transaminase